MANSNTVEVKWMEGLCFETGIMGHKIILESGPDPKENYRGPGPKQLMLSALGGCTGMDVVSILKKMNQKIEYFNVSVEGFLTEEHPKHYYKLHLIFEIKGKNIDIEKVKHAISLSEEKYCGVWAVYKKTMGITWEIKLLE